MLFYNAVLMTKHNDIAPRTDLELIIAILILVFDLILSAQIFGNIAVLIK
jgi:hypothetical protein